MEWSNEEFEEKMRDCLNCIKLKGVLMSTDNGKTWFIFRQDYLTHSETDVGQFDFVEGVNLVGLPLKIFFGK